MAEHTVREWTVNGKEARIVSIDYERLEAYVGDELVWQGEDKSMQKAISEIEDNVRN